MYSTLCKYTNIPNDILYTCVPWWGICGEHEEDDADASAGFFAPRAGTPGLAEVVGPRSSGGGGIRLLGAPTVQ